MALKKAGAIVPDSFEEFGATINRVYKDLVKQGTIQEKPEPEPPLIPMDYQWAQKLGLIRKPTSFISTISDERGDELLYSGVPISQIFEEDIGIGGVISLLWFKRRLPKYASKVKTSSQLLWHHKICCKCAIGTVYYYPSL